MFLTFIENISLAQIDFLEIDPLDFYFFILFLFFIYLFIYLFIYFIFLFLYFFILFIYFFSN